MNNPPITGIPDLDSYLFNLQLNGIDNAGGGYSSNASTGEITDSDGNVVGYLYQYIHIKYATDNVGTGFSDSPTNAYYYGVHNSTSSTESTNPADYTWYNVAGGFGVSYFLFYSPLGGRNIKFAVATSAPDYRWTLTPTTAISLDTLVPSNTISSSEILEGAVTELKLADDAVTAAKLNVAAISGTTGNLVANSVGTTQIADDAVTTQKIVANAITAGKIAADSVTAVKIAADAVTSSKIQAGAVTADKITVNNLAAINANLGTVTAGEVIITKPSSTTPAISGNTMTGAGSRLYSDGKVIFGNSTTNVVFDGTDINFNGFESSARSEVNQYSALATPEEKVLLTFTIDKEGPVMYGVNTEVRTYAQTINIVSFMSNFRFRLYNSANTLITDIPRTLTSGAYYEPGTGNRSMNSPFSFQDIKTLAADTYKIVIMHVGSNGTLSNSTYGIGVLAQLNYTIAFYQVLKLN